MNQIEELKKAAHAATNALWQAEAVERDNLNAALVGKCFKYSNSGGGSDKRWWLYLKILRVDDGNLRAFKFQQYANDSEHIEIEPNEFIYHGRSLTSDGGYTEIKPAEYEREWASLLDKINAYSHT